MMKFKNSYKQELARVIEENGLNLNSFQPTEDQSTYSMNYNGSFSKSFFFVKSQGPDVHKVKFSTYYQPAIKEIGFQTFDLNLKYFSRWIRILKEEEKEFNTPDPWGQINSAETPFNFINTDFNNEVKFTEDEQINLEKRLISFQHEVIEKLNLNDAQTNKLREGIQYLINESKEQSKFNWINIALAVVTFTLPPLLKIEFDKVELLKELFIGALKVIDIVAKLN